MSDVANALIKEFFPDNPHVLDVNNNRVLLDLDYLQSLYEISGRRGSGSVIKAAMEKDGFDVDKAWSTLPNNIALRFQHWGRPEHEDWFTFCRVSDTRYQKVIQAAEKMDLVDCDKAVQEDIGGDTLQSRSEKRSDKAVPDTVPDTASAPESLEEPFQTEGDHLSPADQAETFLQTEDELLKAGKFMFRGRGISLTPEVEEQLLSYLPEITVEEALDKIGIPSASLSKDRIKKIKSRMEQLLERSQKTLPLSESKEQPTVSSADTPKEDSPKDVSSLRGSMSDEELLATGLFIPAKAGIGLHPDFEKAIYSTYPEKSIEEAFLEAGLTVEQVGKGRIYRLRYKFEGFEGKDPSLYKDGSYLSSYRPEVVESYQDHPYIERFTEAEIVLSDRFMEDACRLSSLPIKTLLQVFCLEPGLFSLTCQSELQQKLQNRQPSPPKDPSFEEITSCGPRKLRIMINRVAALDYLIEEEVSRIKDELLEMGYKEKRTLFLTIQSFPRDLEGKYTTSWFLDRLSISRSTFYAIMRNETYGDTALAKEEQDEKDVALIKRVMEYKGFRKGSRQIYMMLPDLEGTTFALSKIRRLMDKFSLESGIRQPNPSRRKAKKYMEEAVAPNTLARRFRLFKPGQALLTDVTYLTYGETRERAYCSAILDAPTGVVKALNISQNNDIELVKESLRLADENPKVEGGFIHSDQGCLYLSPEFRKEIERMGLARSMSRRGNCFDNSIVESFNGTLKAEVDYAACRTFEELKALIESYWDYYNNERRRWDRDQMTPVQYEAYLLSMTEEAWNAYLRTEEERYSKMKIHSAEKAKENAKKCMGLDI